MMLEKIHAKIQKHNSNLITDKFKYLHFCTNNKVNTEL